MATKKQKRSKELAHKMKMQEKKVDAIWYDGVCEGCQFTLLMAYASLASEGFQFDMEKLGKFRQNMDRYSVYMKDGVLRREEMIEVLLKKGIDVTKIGDEYVNEV